LKKEEVKKLGEKLTLKKRNAWFTLDRDAVFAYSKQYMNFIGKSVTERLAVRNLVDLLRENGFKPLSSFEESGVKKGDRIYITKDSKALIATVIGEDLADGIDMVAAHLDAPRLDLKPTPLVEDSELAMLKTLLRWSQEVSVAQHTSGIRRYRSQEQWRIGRCLYWNE
jgi:hypothetical protein